LIVAKLTPREMDVLQSMAKDMTNLEIGLSLGITTRTVETIRNKLYHKLTVKTGGGAVAKAVKLMLLHL
jgi:DNA-binding CsgD family transcriptional regulator